jgi:LysM repeat protein
MKKASFPIAALCLLFLAVAAAGPALAWQAAATRTPTTDPNFTPPPFVPLLTATPLPDGSIVHEVGPGESLWFIALSYGVKIEEIRQLNGLPEGSTDIYAGQKLIIRPAGAATPGTSEADTPEPTLQPTRTRRPTATRQPTATRRVTPTETPAPTPTPTRAPLIPGVKLPDNQTLGLILLGVSVVGIAFVLVFGFLRK